MPDETPTSLPLRSDKDVLPSKILIAEDHRVTREALRTLLELRAFDVTAVATGNEAREMLLVTEQPTIALIDWNLPGVTGPEVCRAVRARPSSHHIYLIIVTAREGEEDIAEAMSAGADDFIRKPCGVAELLARVRAGQRTIRLQHSLESRIAELEEALEHVRQLKRLLPICMYCKKVRDDSDYWQEIDVYIRDQTGTDFSHGICPTCMSAVMESLPPATHLGAVIPHG